MLPSDKLESFQKVQVLTGKKSVTILSNSSIHVVVSGSSAKDQEKTYRTCPHYQLAFWSIAFVPTVILLAQWGFPDFKPFQRLPLAVCVPD